MSSSRVDVVRSPYHHGDLRNALLEAARAVARDTGADKLTLREVARRAGVSHAAAYHHFTDKNALLRAIAVEAFVDLDAIFTQRVVIAQPLAPTLELLAVDYLRFATDREAEFSFMWRKELCMPDGEPDPLKDAQLASQTVISAYIQSRENVDLATTSDPALATLAFWSLVHGFTTIVLSTPAFKHAARAERESVLRLALQQLLSGLSA